MGIDRKWAATWFANYKGQTGQWAQLLHRVTGLLILLFLLAHIVDTSLVGFGPGVYDAWATVYHNRVVRVFELLLVGTVIYHALNGIRVTIIDFWDKGSIYQERLFWGAMVLFFILFGPTVWLMLFVNP